MIKKLNEQAIQNELNHSAFFSKAEPPIPQPDDPVDRPAEQSPTLIPTPTNHETMPPRDHDTVIPRYHDLLLEDIRKALKSFGKEAATYRFTPSEKSNLANIIYHYKQTGIRTSENEITRIAINFILKDHKEFGEDSILDLVLKLLNR